MQGGWGRIMLIVACSLAVLFALSAVAKLGWHRYQVWQADGIWCVRFNDAGQGQRFYGDDCQNQTP